MQTKDYALTFPTGTVRYLFQRSLSVLPEEAPRESTIIITDEHLFRLYKKELDGYRTFTVPAGENTKTPETAHQLAARLLELEVHKAHSLVGFGGGMITDLTGYLAATYMRGIPCAFVPASLLGMVDAAIGGKNGVNVGLRKNILGTVRQPSFIYFDTALLATLPDEEWSNGFAEIIKYGCIADARILTTLETNDLKYFQHHAQQLDELIAGCVDVKNKIVLADEEETSIRRLLNFGHTAGHAIEQQYSLPHGHAVALGMQVATHLSIRHAGLEPAFAQRLTALLQQYGLPYSLAADVNKTMELLHSDKKRDAEVIHFVLLEKPGVAVVQPLSFDVIRDAVAAVLGE